MIQINLLPGTQKRGTRKAGGGFALKLPSSAPSFDRIQVFIIAAWILGLGVLGWLYMGVRGERADAEVAIEQAVADSARYARLIETQHSLRARQDTIAEKLAIIQEIDAGRYIWPHVLDEVSRAMPPYTWLEAIDQVSGGPKPQFQIEGRTGSLPALTRFMDALEASPFVRNVELISSQQAQVDNDPNKIVNDFALTGVFDQPPLEAIETVPLFEGRTGETTPDGSEASDGAAGTT